MILYINYNTLIAKKSSVDERFLTIVRIINRHGVKTEEGQVLGNISIDGYTGLAGLHDRKYKLYLALQYFRDTGKLIGLNIVGKSLLVVEAAMLLTNGEI
jgi:hypothetical protein